MLTLLVFFSSSKIVFSNMSKQYQKNVYTYHDFFVKSLKHLKHVPEHMFTLLVTFLKHLKNVSEKNCLHFSWLFPKNSKMCQKDYLHFSWLFPNISKMCQKYCLHFSWLFEFSKNHFSEFFVLAFLTYFVSNDPTFLSNILCLVPVGLSSISTSSFSDNFRPRPSLPSKHFSTYEMDWF